MIANETPCKISTFSATCAPPSSSQSWSVTPSCHCQLNALSGSHLTWPEHASHITNFVDQVVRKSCKLSEQDVAAGTIQWLCCWSRASFPQGHAFDANAPDPEQWRMTDIPGLWLWLGLQTSKDSETALGCPGIYLRPSPAVWEKGMQAAAEAASGGHPADRTGLPEGWYGWTRRM